STPPTSPAAAPEPPAAAAPPAGASASGEAAPAGSSHTGSLSRRMLLIAAGWISILLLAGGVALDRTLTGLFENQFDEQLHYQLTAMIASGETDPYGDVGFSRQLSDQRFVEPDSSLSCQVRRGGARRARRTDPANPLDSRVELRRARHRPVRHGHAADLVRPGSAAARAAGDRAHSHDRRKPRDRSVAARGPADGRRAPRAARERRSASRGGSAPRGQ